MGDILGWIFHPIAYFAVLAATAIPLWAWIIIAVTLVLLAVRLFGLRGAAIELGVMAVIIAVIQGQKAGRQFQIEKDTKDAQKLEQNAAAARARAIRNNGGLQPSAYDKSKQFRD